MAQAPGSRTQRIYEALHDRIRTGELAPGTRLPSHRDLAALFGVAPMTVRQALARLEQEGLVSREHGRGTFVRAQTIPCVLIVEDEVAVRALLHAHVTGAGYNVVDAGGPDDARTQLESDHAISLILSAVRTPTREAGIAFIRLVRQRWPHLPLVAVMGYPDDLAELHGTPEYPILMLTKPIRAPHVQEILHLTVRPRARAHPMR